MKIKSVFVMVVVILMFIFTASATELSKLQIKVYTQDSPNAIFIKKSVEFRFKPAYPMNDIIEDKLILLESLSNQAVFRMDLDKLKSLEVLESKPVIVTLKHGKKYAFVKVRLIAKTGESSEWYWKTIGPIDKTIDDTDTKIGFIHGISEKMGLESEALIPMGEVKKIEVMD